MSFVETRYCLIISNTRGNFYHSSKQYEKALAWYKKTYQLGKKYGQEFYKDIANINRSEIYLLMYDYKSAKKYLDKASASYDTPDANPAIKFYLNGLYASLYSGTNQIAKAESILNQPFDSAMVNSVYIFNHNRRLEELYEKKAISRKHTNIESGIMSLTMSCEKQQCRIILKNSILDIRKTPLC